MQEKNKENANISERILQLIEYYRTTPNSFAKKIGYERSQMLYDIINGKSKPSYDFFKRLLDSEYSVNIEWLISGDGDMLNKEKPIENKDDTKIISSLKEIIKEKDQEIKTLNREIGKLENIIDDYKKKIHNVPQKDKNNITLK